MKTQQPRYTPEQWDKIKPAFRSLSIGTVDLAKAVLVDGERPSDLARKTGESRQLIYAAVKRVRSILQENHAQELEPVMVWLPADLAAQVREMAKPYDQKPGKPTKN